MTGGNGSQEESYYNPDDCNATFTQPWELELRYATSIVGSAIAGAGALSNFLVLFVFARFSNKKPSLLLLIALAIFDICVLLCYHLIYAVQLISEYHHNGEIYEAWATYVPYLFPFSRVSQMCTIYIVVLAAVERCVTLTHYRLSQRMFSHRNVLKILVGIFLVSALFNASRHWEVFHQVMPNCTGISRHRVSPSSLIMKNELYRKVYSVWLSSIVLIIAPFIILLVLVILNFLQFKRAMSDKMLEAMYRSALEAASRTRQLRDGTMVMLVLVISYLCFNTLGMFITMWEFIDRAGLNQREHFYVLAVELINMGAITNSGIRIINYLVFNHEFRYQTRRLLFGRQESQTVMGMVKEILPPAPITVTVNPTGINDNNIEMHCQCFGGHGEFTEPIYV